MITLIDYGAGNLFSLKNAFCSLGFLAKTTRSKREIKRAKVLVLPGVGSFKKTIENLKSFGILEVILKEVLEKKKPFLGICLGLQIFFEESQEGDTKGLGIFKGKVKRFRGIITPHMGWNQVKILKDSKIFRGIKDGEFFYFCHSYYAPLTPFTVGVTNYKVNFSSVILKENILLTQFHPEKSQKAGLKFLKNFLKIC